MTNPQDHAERVEQDAYSKLSEAYSNQSKELGSLYADNKRLREQLAAQSDELTTLRVKAGVVAGGSE